MNTQYYPIKLFVFFELMQKSPETFRNPETFIECSHVAAPVLITQLPVLQPLLLEPQLPEQPLQHWSNVDDLCNLDTCTVDSSDS